MKLQNTSMFNLIEIFRNRRKKIVTDLAPKTHCEQKAMHDFYCDGNIHPMQHL